MMELAELAEKERLRVQHEARLQLARPVAQKPSSPRSSNIVASRRFPFANLPLFSSPICMHKTVSEESPSKSCQGLFPALPTGLPPPRLPSLPTSLASTTFNDLLCANALQTLLVAHKTSTSTVFSRSPSAKSVSHSVSSILGEVSPSTSAFQPVKTASRP